MALEKALKTSLRPVVVSATLLAAFAGPSLAQEKIVLRLANSLPPTHEVVQFATQYFMETVTKEMGDQVTFQYFGAEQLGKARDLLTLTIANATDIGYVAPSLVPEKLPLGEIAQIPGLFNHACQGTMAFYQLATKGVLATEYKQNGVRPLIVVLQPPNALFLTRAFPADMANLQGLKIRSTGGAQDLVVKSLKAVPIRTSGPELYESLSRGTVDGMVVSYNSLLSYGWIDAAKFGTIGESFGSFAFSYTISETKWQTLPERLRDVLTKVGLQASQRACEMMQKDVEKTQAALREKGMKFSEIGASSKAAFEAALGSVSREWAGNLDRRGKAGSQTLKEFQAAVKALP